MDFPGVSFFIENKNIFPLSSKIQQSKMPSADEFQGVPITGHKIDTQCYLDVKDSKYSNNLLPDKDHGFTLVKGEQFSAKRDMCGHFNSFPAISISQLVGGFVGSKSQIRSVNREACQIWDVIFRQLADTAYQPPNIQNGAHHYYKYSKTSYSQNLFNAFCQEGRTALDGIASYVISQNCEFLQEQEMIHSMSKSNLKSKCTVVESSLNEYKGVLESTVTAPKISVSVDYPAAMNLVSTPELSSTSIPKQSYADVTKSVTTKSESQTSVQQSTIFNKISPRLRKMRNLEEKKPSFHSRNQIALEHARPSHLPVFNTSSKYTQTMSKHKYKESQSSCRPTSKSEPSCKQLPNFNYSPQHVKKMTESIKGQESSYWPASETGSWRTRQESVDHNFRQPLQNTNHSCQYKHFNTVYPAFNRKSRVVGSKGHGNKIECFSKRQNSDQGSSKVGDCYISLKSTRIVDLSDAPPFGRKFKRLSKGFHSKIREIHKGRRDRDYKNMYQFSSHTGGADVCTNWRSKHKGVVCCGTVNREDLVSARLNVPITLTKNIPESCVKGNSCVVTESNGEGSIGTKNLQNQSQCDEPLVTPNLLLDFSSNLDCISVSSSCGDISDISGCRNRFLSECSVDSDDSFVVMFESECVEDRSAGDCGARQMYLCTSLDSDTSDGWSECESDDDDIAESDNESEGHDEIDFCFYPSSLPIPPENLENTDNIASPLPDRLKDINKKWIEENASIPSKDKSPQKVHFPNSCKLVTVRPMVKWDFAYRAARCGPWEEMARDRARFRARIDRTEPILASVLTPEHRHQVRKRMDSSAIS
ncbi:uncharacterized protein PPP1R15 [Anabrus simplex]|uniref:uncharacterized protein PPP1R15 n=1 Tax=Anabrus simplex TaxID=316456 RepID=UPI0035A28746